MTKPIILSGMQPSGPLHIGNYLGALKNWVEIQNSGKYQCVFFVADYHSLSENYDTKAKREQIKSLVLDYLAIGLDPQKSTIFIQSQVPQSTELAWIFNTLTPVSFLERMTQYKDKAARQEQNINMGLFDYPVLQAADILLYCAELIPVGEDQVQHVELARDVARFFNNKYGEFFKEPKPLLTKTSRVMSLLEPSKKMSKSRGENHCINLADEPEVIAKKLKKAVTATEIDDKSLGVKNLFDLLDAFGKKEHIAKMQKDLVDGTIKYSEIKEVLAADIADYFAPFRAKRKELVADEKNLHKILREGAEKANSIAVKTMKEVKEKIGLLNL